MSRKPRRPNRFTGPLAKKIIATSEAAIFDQQREKILLLFVRYEIKQRGELAFRLLALELAKEFVPGFQVAAPKAPSPGRKKTWKAGRGAELVAAVHEIEEKEKLPTPVALLKLRATAKWNDVTVKTLKNQYHEERARQADAIMKGQEAFAKWASLMGDLPGRSINARIRRANALERPDTELEEFLKRLAELSAA